MSDTVEQVFIEWRNPQYNKYGTIDCEIQHPHLGWIPFTAGPNDPEEHGRELYQAILDSGEHIEPYEPSGSAE